MALGTAAVVGLGLLAGGAGYGASRMMNRGSSSPSSPSALPQPPSMDAAATKAADSVRKRKSQATQSIYTDPLGIGGQADVARQMLKTKTGQ